jgi:hypothetical protein
VWLGHHWLPQAIQQGIRAARRGAGRRVAVMGKAQPQQILVDWLRPRQQVATRAQPKPVLSTTSLGARRNAQEGDGGAG